MKTLCLPAFGNHIIEVDENDTQGIIRTIKTHNPEIILLDTLTNAPEIPMPDMTAIIRFLVKHVKEETYLVVDNTDVSIAFQPLPLFAGRLTRLRLIVFESLNKYHQFGMDRVTGGILWSIGGDTGKLFDYRVNLGTIMPDSLVTSMPTPNRTLLEKRLKRFTRNAMTIASALQEWIDAHPTSPFLSISYPGLPNHPAHKTAHDLSFQGSYCTIRFKKKYQTVSSYKRFVALALETAKRQKVNLIGGTSFGLNTTRIYLTALRSKPVEPFVRIAVGMEHRIALEAMQHVFLSTFSRFR
jgi:cystathionine beta-lyase/cystathionine gamma-synthase